MQVLARRALQLLRMTALVLSTLTLGSACSSPRSSPQEEQSTTATASFAIGTGDLYIPLGSGDNSSQGRLLSASSNEEVSSFAFNYTDVTRLRITVTETASNNPVYVNFDLTRDATGTWRGTLPFLPKNTQLNFHARATGSADTLLFEGTTEQSLPADLQTVVIVLTPANNNQTVSIPRILRISVPSAFGSGQSGNVSFSVEAASGERLSYSITAASSGGSFSPTSGSITLSTTSGTFVSQYSPPTVSAETPFTHQVLITNSAGHSVSTTFTTRVKPPGTTDGALDTALSVQFNPVINALAAKRLVETDRIIWTADVADDGAASELRYAWSFTPAATFNPVPGFMDPAANPAVFQGYTTAVHGMLRMDVTDHNGSGGTTTLFYPLRTNQFPHPEVPLSNIDSVHLGTSHTCALFTNGSLRCWGYNANGQLGLGDTLTYGDDEPAHVAGPVPLAGVGAKLAVGGNHTCALLNNGLVRCWGRNTHGQLGYNTTDHVGDGEQIASYGHVNLGGIARKLAAGLNHTCALMSTGKVRCWGLNSSGQLGYGHTLNVGDNEQPYTYGDVDLGANVTARDIVAGAAHTCALLTNNSVRCWGNNSWGQLGLGNTSHVGDNELPSSQPTVNAGGPVLQLSAGYFHTCALLSETGNIRCWGLNGSGQLGYGNTSDLSAPGPDVAVGGPVLQVASGQDHTCVLLSTGGIKCWGLGAWGQLGLGNANSLASPPSTPVDMGETTAFQVAAGGHHTCALLINGAARCWGLNNHGQLGYGHTNPIGDNELPSAAGNIPLLPPTP